MLFKKIYIYIYWWGITFCFLTAVKSLLVNEFSSAVFSNKISIKRKLITKVQCYIDTICLPVWSQRVFWSQIGVDFAQL